MNGQIIGVSAGLFISLRPGFAGKSGCIAPVVAPVRVAQAN
jgi:hypothetical protein